MSLLKRGGVSLQSSGQANTRIVVIAGLEIFLPTVFEEDCQINRHLNPTNPATNILTMKGQKQFHLNPINSVRNIFTINIEQQIQPII